MDGVGQCLHFVIFLCGYNSAFLACWQPLSTFILLSNARPLCCSSLTPLCLQALWVVSSLQIVSRVHLYRKPGNWVVRYIYWWRGSPGSPCNWTFEPLTHLKRATEGWKTRSQECILCFWCYLSKLKARMKLRWWMQSSTEKAKAPWPHSRHLLQGDCSVSTYIFVYVDVYYYK